MPTRGRILTITYDTRCTGQKWLSLKDFGATDFIFVRSKNQILIRRTIMRSRARATVHRQDVLEETANEKQVYMDRLFWKWCKSIFSCFEKIKG